MNKTLSVIDSIYLAKGLKAFLHAYDLHTTKALGQNFFLNPNLLNAMLDAAQFPTSGTVIEVGPGLGHLTWQMLKRGLDVTAVEYDTTFIEALKILDESRIKSSESQDLSSLTIIENDALKVFWKELVEKTGARRIIGNLPYNVSVPILFELAYIGHPLEGFYATIQKEVGDRIVAQPGSKDYGKLSIVLNYLCEIKKLKGIPRDVFFPRPNVESVFIQFIPKTGVDYELSRLYMERLVKLGFAHRRKKVRSQLKGAIIERRVFDEAFMNELENHFNLDDRAEQWDLDIWIRLAEFVRNAPPRE